MILVVSVPEDEHAMRVLAALEEQGAPATLLDVRRLPGDLALSVSYPSERAISMTLGNGTGQPIDLDDVGAAWWRRPQAPDLDGEVSDPTHRTFAYGEWDAALGGLWLLLDAEWINEPGLDQRASRKPYQLQVAREVGLETPETLITSDPARAEAFIGARPPGETICKAFSATEEAWRETRIVGDREMARLDAVRHAPVIFQEYVDADVDLRVTVVGDRIFPAAIHSQESAYPVDYRMDMGATDVEAAELPADVERGLRDFMDRMGLVYGAIDLRRTPGGRHVFLEVNPSGQWLFVEDRTGQPVTETFCRALVEMEEASAPGD